MSCSESYESLTEEQSCFVKHQGEAYLTACPGAGKTRAIVARLKIKLSELPARKGIATLSFTNAAADELRNRCIEEDIIKALQSPSLISTFDSFLQRYIFQPLYSESDKKPHVVDSWDRFGIEIRLRGKDKAFRGEGLSLDLFSENGIIADIEKIGSSALKHHYLRFYSDYKVAALNYLKRLRSNGYFSASQVRELAISSMSEPDFRDHIIPIIKARFSEILVDEAQDCNESDVRIIEELRKNGIPVSVICDPDQAIYTFRTSSVDSVPIRPLREKYESFSQQKLTGNFRSTKNICDLASLFRFSGEVDKALGSRAELDIPIQILKYKGAIIKPEIGTSFEKLLDRFGIDYENSRVLAHSRAHASRATGNKTPKKSTANIAKIAFSASRYHSSSSSPKEVVTAVRDTEKLIVEYLTDGLDEIDIEKLLAEQNDDAKELRRLAVSFLDSIPWHINMGPENWINIVKRKFSDLGFGLKSARGQSVNQFLKKPSSNEWTKSLADTLFRCRVRSSTVHECKGHEFEATCVVLSPDRGGNTGTQDILNSLGKGVDCEAQRVLYVGITRARSLAALAIQDKYSDRLERVLNSTGVDYEVTEVDT